MLSEPSRVVVILLSSFNDINMTCLMVLAKCRYTRMGLGGFHHSASKGRPYKRSLVDKGRPYKRSLVEEQRRTQ